MVTDPCSVKPRLRGVSHLVALCLAPIAGWILVTRAPAGQATLAAAIYVASLVGMFAVSSLYHRPTWSPGRRRWMRRLDHAWIFILIAGSYTPFCLLAIGGDDGRRLLVIVWAVAALGVLGKLAWVDAPKGLSAAVYVLFGCLVLPSVPTVLSVAGGAVIALMLAGGALYIAGAAIYALRRPDPLPAVFGYHEVFHALVIVASACHFVAVLRVVERAA